MNPVDFIWIAAAIVFVIIEAATMGLATIWFAFAAIVAWLAQVIGVPPLGQIAVFLVVSAILPLFHPPNRTQVFQGWTDKDKCRQTRWRNGQGYRGN